MNRNKTGIVIFAIALILVALFVGCDDFIDRKNFLVTAEKVPYIRSIGFTKADNTELGEDCFTNPLSTDEIVRITLPPDADVFSNLTISFTMNTPKATLNEWDGTQWVPWTSGKTLVSFSNLEDTKHLKAQYFFSYTNTTYEREYIFQLSKPIWLRLKEWKPDFYNDNGQNVVLYLRLIDQEGNDLEADRAKNGTWQSGDGIDIGYDPDELAILNYPPTYDVLRRVFPLNVKPFTNGKLTITFPDGLFKDKHGSLASGYEVSFNFDASWIDKQNTVTFDSNGGSPASTDVTALYGRTVDLPTAQAFSRGNSLLEGWYYDKGIFLKEFDESSRVTGNITVYAKWVSDTAPGVPTNVRAVPGSNHVLLFWVPPLNWGLINDEFASSITYSINVYESGNMGTFVNTIASTTDTMAKITNLKAGTDYTFEISASNGGSILSLATRSWTKTNGASGKPENLQISTSKSTSADKAQVELRWTAPGDPGSDGDSAATISSYTVYYSEKVLTGADLAGASKEEITNLTPTQTTIDGLSSRTPYYFKVTATNSAGLESEAADIPVTTALSDNDAVAIAKANLSIPLPDLSQVMSNFTLPVSGANSTTITWTIVSGTGLSLSGTNSRDATVSSPNSGSFDVQLQATISRGNGSDTKTFDLTIIPESTKTDDKAVENALADLDYRYMQFASGEDKDNVKSDVTLLTTGIEGTTLAWTIASGTAVSIASSQGAPSTAGVSRPDDSDATVVFKVTVSRGIRFRTSTLSITVLKKDNIDKHITFTVKDISISIGESGTHSLGLITALLPGDYSFSIAPPKSAVSIDDSGIITIGPAISSADTGTYTVKAVGAGPNYTGEITADFELTVSAKSLSAVPGFVIEVDNASVTALTGGQQHKASVKGGLTHTTDYRLSISPDANGNIRIDNDGVITIDAGIKVSDAGDYTITATGQGNYPGTVEGVFNLTVNPKTLTTSILGTISNPSTDFEIQAGFTNAKTRTLDFNSPLRANSDYTLAITGSPPDAASGHVNLDSSTGQLTFSPDIVPDDSGTYSVTVYAMGDYSDPATPLTATFMLTVMKAGILSITYSPVTAIFKTAMAQSASPTINPADAAAGARFTISPDLNADTGLSFDPATGAISGTPTIRASGDYSVSIKGGDGTKYDGSTLTSASFSVSIDPKPIEGTLSYDGSNIATTYGTAQALSIQWTGDLPEQTVSYAIAPKNSTDPALPDDILFTTSTGALSVSNLTAVHTGTYTVTASGSGDYGGSKSVDVNIKIKPKALETADFTVQNTVTVTALTANEILDVVTSTSLTAGTDYTLAITNRPITPNAAVVSIDNDGKVSTTEAISMADNSGSYTVTASGNGNYSGTVTGIFTLNVGKIALTSDLLGSISNPAADFEIQAGFANAETRTLNFDGSLTVGTDYTLAISPPTGMTHSHVGIDSMTGKLTISKQILPAHTGTYTVTATGKGNYYTDPANPVTTTFKLNVTAIPVTIKYTNKKLTGSTADSATLTVRVGTVMTDLTPSILPSGALVSRSISPPLNALTGLSFSLGTIRGTPTKSVTQVFNVFIEGWQNTKYHGATDSFTLTIIVLPKLLRSADFSVQNTVTATKSTASTVSAVVTSPLSAGTDYTLDITSRPSGASTDAVSIDNNGEVTITNTIALTDTGTYTVTATGTGNYGGTVERSFTLTVKQKYQVSYNLNQGTNTSGTPSAYDSVDVTKDETIQTAPPAPTKTENSQTLLFKGWYYDDNGTEVKFLFGDTKVTGDMTLTAQWFPAAVIAPTSGTIGDSTKYVEPINTILGNYDSSATLKIYYITEQGSNNFSGADWNNALAGDKLYNTISNISSPSNTNVYLLLIASGNYSITSTLAMKDYVFIIGGWRGDGSGNGGWDRTGDTVLDGSGTKRIFTNTGTGSGGGDKAILYGVTIHNGSADSGGGGMSNENFSPRLIDVVFFQNKSTKGLGGGMYNINSNPTLTNVTFRENTGKYGGAMGNNSSTPILKETKFFNNTGFLGGAMYNEKSSAPELTDVNFKDNKANPDSGISGKGGAIYNASSTPILNTVEIQGNAADVGGAIYTAIDVNPGTSPSAPSLSLNNVSFLNNIAETSGGGIYSESSTLSIENTRFEENSAKANNGGGIYSINTTMKVSKAEFSGNRSSAQDSKGGGIYSENSWNQILNATFYKNSSAHGNGIYSKNSTNHIIHDTFYSEDNNEIYIDGYSTKRTVIVNSILWNKDNNINGSNIAAIYLDNSAPSSSGVINLEIYYSLVIGGYVKTNETNSRLVSDASGIASASPSGVSSIVYKAHKTRAAGTDNPFSSIPQDPDSDIGYNRDSKIRTIALPSGSSARFWGTLVHYASSNDTFYYGNATGLFSDPLDPNNTPKPGTVTSKNFSTEDANGTSRPGTDGYIDIGAFEY